MVEEFLFPPTSVQILLSPDYGCNHRLQLASVGGDSGPGHAMQGSHAVWPAAQPALCIYIYI